MKKSEQDAITRRRDFFNVAVAAAAGVTAAVATACNDGAGTALDGGAGGTGGVGGSGGGTGLIGGADAAGGVGGGGGSPDGSVGGADMMVEPACAGAFEGQDDMEWRWGFAIDLRRCVGCQACSVACKTENDVRLRVFRNSVRTHESGALPDTARTIVPWLCNHCSCPPCLERCPVEPVAATLTFPSGAEVAYQARATFQRPDGLVLIDHERCIGCGRCVVDCPYGARYLDPVEPAGSKPENKAADKCTMCVHRLERGIVPACVNTCQASARIAGNLNDPESEISQLIANNEVFRLKEDAGTLPNVYYIGADPNEAFNQGDDPRVDAQIAFPEHHQEVE